MSHGVLLIFPPLSLTVEMICVNEKSQFVLKTYIKPTYRTKRLKFTQRASVMPLFVPSNLHHSWKTKRMRCTVSVRFSQFTRFDLQYNRILRIIPKVWICICPVNASRRMIRESSIFRYFDGMFEPFKSSKYFAKLRSTQAVANFTHRMKLRIVVVSIGRFLQNGK